MKDDPLKNTNAIHQIDLEEIIRSKNPRLLKFLPPFVLKYIKKIIHQDEFNDFLIQTKDVYEHDFVRETLNYFQIKVQCEGLQNIPEKGGCIVVCNHPLGGMDGIAAMSELGKKRPDLKAMVNDLLMNLQNLNKLLIPVNKHGKNTIQNIRQIDKSFASEDCLIVFPAGLVSRKQNGIIKDLEWKKGFVSKAIKYEQDVIPVHIEASNSSFFYNLARIRKMVGINVNIEMFYLVDEVYKQRGKTIKITIGKPIPHTSFTKAQTQEKWAQMVKEHVYNLKKTKKANYLASNKLIVSSTLPS